MAIDLQPDEELNIADVQEKITALKSHHPDFFARLDRAFCSVGQHDGECRRLGKCKHGFPYEGPHGY